MRPTVLFVSACALAITTSAWAGPPSRRGDLAKACPLAKSWSETDVSVEGKVVGIGRRTFNLRKGQDRERLLDFADRCGAQTPDDTWVKKSEKAESVLTAVGERFQEMVEADQRWFRDKATTCTTKNTLAACLEIALDADLFPLWLREDEQRATSASARTAALRLLEQESKSAVDQCVADTQARPTALGMPEIERAVASCAAAEAALASYKARLNALETTDDEETPLGALETTLREVATGLAIYQKRSEFLTTHAACLKDGAETPCATVTSLKTFATPAEIASANAARAKRVKKDAEERRLQAEREAEAARRAQQAEARAVAILDRAELCAKSRIYDLLRSPSTAVLQAQLVKREGFCYSYKVTVDAQNAFGAYIRNQYCVAVKMTNPWDPKPTLYYGWHTEWDGWQCGNEQFLCSRN